MGIAISNDIINIIFCSVINSILNCITHNFQPMKTPDKNAPSHGAEKLSKQNSTLKATHSNKAITPVRYQSADREN